MPFVKAMRIKLIILSGILIKLILIEPHFSVGIIECVYWCRLVHMMKTGSADLKSNKKIIPRLEYARAERRPTDPTPTLTF